MENFNYLASEYFIHYTLYKIAIAVLGTVVVTGIGAGYCFAGSSLKDKDYASLTVGVLIWISTACLLIGVLWFFLF